MQTSFKDVVWVRSFVTHAYVTNEHQRIKDVCGEDSNKTDIQLTPGKSNPLISHCTINFVTVEPRYKEGPRTKLYHGSFSYILLLLR